MEVRRKKMSRSGGESTMGRFAAAIYSTVAKYRIPRAVPGTEWSSTEEDFFVDRR
jgi:hypothetical protein